MTTQEIVAKLWNLCNVLRDDGITYQDYVTELTYILCLKMMKETGREHQLPEGCRQVDHTSKSDITLKSFYKKLLDEHGTGRIREIYQVAVSNIDEPKNLEKIITSVDGLDQYSVRQARLGVLYEDLLEKSANEKKIRGNTVLIIDAKYYSHTMQQRFDKRTEHSNNLYQIFAYVKNKEAELADVPHEVSGMLLYARTDEEIQPDVTYHMSGNQISVKTLDLGQPFEEIRKQLDVIVKAHFSKEAAFV